MADRSRRNLIRDSAALFSLIAFVTIWHFGVIVGTHQPVGGDKTAFFYGLMSYYGEGLKAGTLPFWNQRWGFGFPQLAESQTGALYLPHLILYRLFGVFDAFRLNFAFHRLAIVVTSFLAFRGMRLRTPGAWLAALTYIGGGFAVGHFDHQWAMESMVWLPPILWASFRIAQSFVLREELPAVGKLSNATVQLTADGQQQSAGKRSCISKFAIRQGNQRTSWLPFCFLPLLVGLQLTIGHFQIAFMTAFTAGVMVVLWAFLELLRRKRLSERRSVGGSQRKGQSRPVDSPKTSAHPTINAAEKFTMMDVWKKTLFATGAWLVAIALGYGIAAAQLAPTNEFANEVRARNRLSHGFDYLSTHSLPPWVNLNLGLPALYFREPLWRAAVWTPAHSAPEECLNYVGLLPLCLAMGGVLRWRRVPFVRTWLILFLAAMWFSWGPFMQPTFRFMIHVPGFSFFRSSARWLLIQNVALGLMAGWTFDRVRSPKLLAKWWRRWLIVWLLVAVHIAALWYGFDAIARAKEVLPSKPVQSILNAIFPFGEDDVGFEIVRGVGEPRTWDGDTWKLWVKAGRGSIAARLIDEWPYVIRTEILPTVGVIVLTSLLLWVAVRWPRRSRLILCAIMLIDLGCFAMLFPDTSVPCDKLRTDGPIARKLKSLGPDARIAASFANFAMAYDVQSLQAYRTLDIPLSRPIAEFLGNAMSMRPMDQPFRIAQPLTVLGIKAIVIHPFPSAQLIQESKLEDNPWTTSDVQFDLWIDGSLEFRKLLASRGITGGTKIEVVEDHPRNAILVDAEKAAYAHSVAMQQPSASFAENGEATRTAMTPTSRKYSVDVKRESNLVIGELFLKGWDHATVKEERSWEVPAEVAAFSNYFQHLPKPLSPGKYQVELKYDPPGWRLGCALSLASLAVWLALSSVLLVRKRR